MDSESEKLASLSERIRKEESDKMPKPPSGGAGRIGFDFVGSVLGSVVLGVVCDRVFGTTPWCLLVFLVVGFIGGMVAVWKALQKNDESGK